VGTTVKNEHRWRSEKGPKEEVFKVLMLFRRPPKGCPRALLRHTDP